MTMERAVRQDEEGPRKKDPRRIGVKKNCGILRGRETRERMADQGCQSHPHHMPHIPPP